LTRASRTAIAGVITHLRVVQPKLAPEPDLPGLLLFGLGDPDLEHAAVEVGLDPVISFWIVLSSAAVEEPDVVAVTVAREHRAARSDRRRSSLVGMVTIRAGG